MIIDDVDEMLIKKGMDADEEDEGVVEEREESTGSGAESSEPDSADSTVPERTGDERVRRENEYMQDLRETSGAPRQLDQQEMLRFIQTHKGLDPRAIPKSVWDDVKKGVDLTDAYNRFEVQQLRRQNEDLHRRLYYAELNKNNRQKSLGSMKTGRGQIYPFDTFMDQFDRA